MPLIKCLQYCFYEYDRRKCQQTEYKFLVFLVYCLHVTYRVIFMENHIPIRPDRSLLLGRLTSKWSLWDVVNLKILWLIGLSLNSVLTLFKKYEDNYIIVCEFALTLILSTPNPVRKKLQQT